MLIFRGLQLQEWTMQRTRGFSLTEILISLFLITSISLALLKQQWQVNQLLHKVLKRFETLNQSDNQAESDCERRTQSGFGLIELCISLLLVSILMSSLMQHYLQVKQQYLRVQSTIDNINDIQLISDLMRMSIRRAGFTPCLTLNQLETMDVVSGQANLRALSFGDNSYHIQRMDDNFSEVLSIDNHRYIKVHSSANFQIGHPVLIADCYHAEVQQIESISQGMWINLEKLLVYNYKDPIYIGPWIKESFYIKNNHEGRPALFYKERDAEELTCLVNSMVVKAHYDIKHLLVRIILSLSNGKKHTVDARVRGI